jgi:hypothetical protein
VKMYPVDMGFKNGCMVKVTLDHIWIAGLGIKDSEPEVMLPQC